MIYLKTRFFCKVSWSLHQPWHNGSMFLSFRTCGSQRVCVFLFNKPRHFHFLPPSITKR